MEKKKTYLWDVPEAEESEAAEILSSSQSSQPLSVSALTNLIKETLEGFYSSVTVQGEVSNAKLSSSGHLYFSLKDREALIQAVMFKYRLAFLGFELRDGMKLIVSGGVSVYAARGQYQLIAQNARLAGTGDILAMLEERKRRLAAEGLFDDERKRPLPRFPSKVALVTSPSGAAVRDIIHVLGRRNAGVDLIILPCPVQGEGAAELIAARIRQANRLSIADVLIVGRGGGSLEDLLAFSDEAVVRAVAESEIPVISAVGHEIDWAICDYAADLRAATPSAAAELVAESRATLLSEIERFELAIESTIRARLDRAEAALDSFALKDVEARFMRLFLPVARRLDDARETLVLDIGARLKDLSHRRLLADNALELTSPLAVLNRGYSITRKLDLGGAEKTQARGRAFSRIDGPGPVVRSAGELKKTETLQVIFASGSARVEVEEVEQ
ncbi:MAG: exodeoxyribonuclease VII large subunit [Spirochaetales bacterium]|nr:exodeoxyribonuclease VII large subunit [Spirochaetales bacterium]